MCCQHLQGYVDVVLMSCQSCQEKMDHRVSGQEEKMHPYDNCISVTDTTVMYMLCFGTRGEDAPI
jgi:hypothetical protein